MKSRKLVIQELHSCIFFWSPARWCDDFVTVNLTRATHPQ